MIKDTYIKTRATKDEKEQYNKWAQSNGMTLLDLIRDLFFNEILKKDNK